MGSSNETSYFGPVRNPWDAARGARRQLGRLGGGGGGAPRARRRPAPTPAARSASRRRCRGICGLKPTYGVVSRYGMIAFASSLDQGGPIAQQRRGPGAAAERDGRASTRATRPASSGRREDYTRELGRAARRACASACRRNTSARASTPTCAARSSAAIAEFEQLGRDDASRSTLPNTQLVGAGVLRASRRRKRRRNLSRFDGVRYGHRAPEYGDLLDMYCKHARRGLRRRGEAAHPDRHLRAVARLLRRLLPAGAEGAAPDRAATSPRRSSAAT